MFKCHNTQNLIGKVMRFTLIELLIVIAIMGILFCFMLPALKKAKDKASEIQCKGNLRQLVVCSYSYADDFGGLLPIVYDSSANRMWNEVFNSNNYIPLLVPNKPTIIICPAYYPKVWIGDRSRTYGMAAYYEGSFQNIALSKINKTSDWPLYSDSINDTDRTPAYIIKTDWGRYVHLRHSRRANIGYVDGSCRSESSDSLMRFRQASYYADKNFFSYSIY